jgi:fatty acid desaturase
MPPSRGSLADADASRRYRKIRRILLALFGLYVAIAALIAGLDPRPLVIAGIAVVAVLENLTTHLMLRQAKKDVEPAAPSPDRQDRDL